VKGRKLRSESANFNNLHHPRQLFYCSGSTVETLSSLPRAYTPFRRLPPFFLAESSSSSLSDSRDSTQLWVTFNDLPTCTSTLGDSSALSASASKSFPALGALSLQFLFSLTVLKTLYLVQLYHSAFPFKPTSSALHPSPLRLSTLFSPFFPFFPPSHLCHTSLRRRPLSKVFGTVLKARDAAVLTVAEVSL
jgi:hypothetical protein